MSFQKEACLSSDCLGLDSPQRSGKAGENENLTGHRFINVLPLIKCVVGIKALD